MPDSWRSASGSSCRRVGAAGFQGAQTGDQHADISERALAAFVEAYVENQNIRVEYEPALRNSTDAKTRQEIQERANEELKKALAKHNLSVEKYKEIYKRVNSDAALRAKVLQLVDEEWKRST